MAVLCKLSSLNDITIFIVIDKVHSIVQSVLHLYLLFCAHLQQFILSTGGQAWCSVTLLGYLAIEDAPIPVCLCVVVFWCCALSTFSLIEVFGATVPSWVKAQLSICCVLIHPRTRQTTRTCLFYKIAQQTSWQMIYIFIFIMKHSSVIILLIFKWTLRSCMLTADCCVSLRSGWGT